MARSRQTAQQLARWELQEAAGCAAVPLRWLITRMAPYSCIAGSIHCAVSVRCLSLATLAAGFCQPLALVALCGAPSQPWTAACCLQSAAPAAAAAAAESLAPDSLAALVGAMQAATAAVAQPAASPSSSPAASSACWGNRSFSSAAGSAASARRLAAAAQQPPPVAAAADAAALEALDQLPLWRFLQEQGFTQQAIRQMQRGVRGTRYSEQKVHADLALNFAALRQEGLDTAAIQQLYQKRSKMLHTTQATFTNSLAVPVLS